MADASGVPHEHEDPRPVGAPTPLAGRTGRDDTAAVDAVIRAAVRAEAGPLTDIALEHLAGGGKRLRARLALSASRALGVARRDASVWAAAVELIHEASLVHDDLQDGDRVRRGRATTWVRHGAAQAINAGDLLLLVPFSLIASSGAPHAAALGGVLASCAARMARGQAEEPFLLATCRDDPRAARAAYLSCIEKKTGALFAASVLGAARMAGRDAAAASALARPFIELGMLFQIVDDYLDLWGEKGRDKPGNDVREGKVSALVVAHLARAPEDAAWLCGILERPRDDTTDDDVAAVDARFTASGARAAVGAEIAQRARIIVDDEGLRGAPRLAEIAAALVDKTLAPIRVALQTRSDA